MYNSINGFLSKGASAIAFLPAKYSPRAGVLAPQACVTLRSLASYDTHPLFSLISCFSEHALWTSGMKPSNLYCEQIPGDSHAH